MAEEGSASQMKPPPRSITSQPPTQEAVIDDLIASVGGIFTLLFATKEQLGDMLIAEHAEVMRLRARLAERGDE